MAYQTIDELKDLIIAKRGTLLGWFFPSDIIPHSRRLRYYCEKYYKQGLLERGNANRWGYYYRIKGESDE